MSFETSLNYMNGVSSSATFVSQALKLIWVSQVLVVVFQ